MKERAELPFVAVGPLPGFPEIAVAYPSAALLAALGENALSTGESLEPIYLRLPYTTTPKATPWIR